MKNLNSSVARLKRTGGENAIWLSKLRAAIDDVAQYLKRYVQDPERTLSLPRGYEFRHYPARHMRHEWALRREATTDRPAVFIFGCGFRVLPSFGPRTYLLTFADDMATGWFEEVEKLLKQNNFV
jgi:hypothetical protein